MCIALLVLLSSSMQKWRGDYFNHLPKLCLCQNFCGFRQPAKVIKRINATESRGLLLYLLSIYEIVSQLEDVAFLVCKKFAAIRKKSCNWFFSWGVSQFNWLHAHYRMARVARYNGAVPLFWLCDDLLWTWQPTVKLESEHETWHDHSCYWTSLSPAYFSCKSYVWCGWMNPSCIQLKM